MSNQTCLQIFMFDLLSEKLRTPEESLDLDSETKDNLRSDSRFTINFYR